MNSELIELTKSHLDQLRRINVNLQHSSRNLQDYYEHMSNSFDASQDSQSETDKTKRLRINENLIMQREKQNKKFHIEWNVEYCKYCKINYWPSNCRPFVRPKYGMSRRVSKLFTRYKLRNYTPKYRSFKSKIIKNILKRSMKLYYKCVRCKSKNLIVKELQRAEPKTLNPKKHDKKLTNKLLFDRIYKSQPLKNVNLTTVQNQAKPGEVKSKNQSAKFHNSLLKKLKACESEQEKIQNEKKNSSGSLADFLQKLF